MSRYRPECACASSDVLEFERRVIVATIGCIVSLSHNAQMQMLCVGSHRHLMLTAITSLVMGMSCDTTKQDGKVVEAEFDVVLETLVADVRERRAVMDAYNEKVKQGGRTQ